MEEKVSPEKFELALRLLGNEVFAFSLQSESPRKNWIVVAAIIVILVSALANSLLPLITALAALG